MWWLTCNYNTCTGGCLASFLILLVMDAWRPKHVEWLCRNKTCTVLYKVVVSFDLYCDARKHKINKEMWWLTCNETHVPVAAVPVLNTPDDGRLRPKHVEWLCRNKTCTVLHQVGVSFDLYCDARKQKIKIRYRTITVCTLIWLRHWRTLRLLSLTFDNTAIFIFYELEIFCFFCACSLLRHDTQFWKPCLILFILNCVDCRCLEVIKKHL